MRERPDSDPTAEFLADLIARARQLLGEIFDELKSTDERGKRHWRTPPTSRHRLMELVDAAERTIDSLPSAIVGPDFIAELLAAVQAMETYKNEPEWSEIRPALASPDHFPHTILKLLLADLLRRAGNRVSLGRRTDRPSADLVLKAVGGTEELVNLECKQPRALRSPGRKLSRKNARRIVDRDYSRAVSSGQLAPVQPGILAIGGFHLPDKSMKLLEEAAHERLKTTSAKHVLAIVIVNTCALVETDGQPRLTATISMRAVSNPNYTGSVGLSPSPAPALERQRVKGPLKEIWLDTVSTHRLEGGSLMRSGAIVNETVEDEDVLLDGARIVDSTFRRCKLIFRGERPFQAQDSGFIDCFWEFEGPAALTVEFLKTIYAAGGNLRNIVEEVIREIRGSTTVTS